MGKGGANPEFETAKWATLAVNFLTALAGAALMGLGVYGLLNPLGSALVPMTLPVVSIAAGVVVLLSSLVGCFGAVAEHRTTLLVYFGLLLLLVVLQFVVGIVALTNRGGTISKVIDNRWNNLYDDHPRYIRDIQDQYQCCGLETPYDRAWPKRGVPCADNIDYGYSRSCIGPVRHEWEDRQTTFGIGVCILAGLQLIGLVPVYYLASRLPTSEQERDRSLLEEHRQLLEGHRVRPAYGAGGVVGGQGGRDPAVVGARPGGVQHVVGGPAGSYHSQGNRPGARIG